MTTKSIKSRLLFAANLVAFMLILILPTKTYAGSWGVNGEGWYNLTVLPHQLVLFVEIKMF